MTNTRQLILDKLTRQPQTAKQIHAQFEHMKIDAVRAALYWLTAYNHAIGKRVAGCNEMVYFLSKTPSDLS